MDKKFNLSLIIYTDGGSRGNPGPGAAGAVIFNNKEELLKECSEYLGISTNNQAEYRAVILSLKKAKALFGKKIAKDIEIEIKSDSEFLVKQLNGEYKVLDKKIQPLFLETWNLRLDFKNVKFLLIPREENKKADTLVNEVLDSQDKNQTLF